MEIKLAEFKQGSEKQRKWATDIRNKMLSDFEKIDLDRYKMMAYKDEELKEICNQAKKIFETEDRASFYIEFKSFDMFKLAENMVIEEREKEKLKNFLTEEAFKEHYTQKIIIDNYHILIKYEVLDTNLRVIYAMLFYEHSFDHLSKKPRNLLETLQQTIDELKKYGYPYTVEDPQNLIEKLCDRAKK